MSRRRAVRVISSRRPGRLVPRGARGLRAGVVVLKPGGIMEWHSTRSREELLIMLAGRVQVEVEGRSGCERVGLTAGACAQLPQRTRHRIVNRSGRIARYVYVTAPVR